MLLQTSQESNYILKLDKFAVHSKPNEASKECLEDGFYLK